MPQRPRKNLSRRRLVEAAPFGLIALFTAVLLRPLLAGQALYWGDILLYFEPMQNFARSELMSGRLPLWNPYTLCGQPFIGNPQMSVFYPPNLMLTAVPAWMALSIGAALHLFLCGAFMYLFLRRWTVRMIPAVAGAATYMGSAYLLGRLQFPPMIQTAAYVPLLFSALDANVDRTTLRNFSLLALTIALIVLAAHTQIAYLAFLSGLAYTVMRLVRRRVPVSRKTSGIASRSSAGLRIWAAQEARFFAFKVAPMGGACLLGLMLTGIYLLPAAEVLHASSREQMTVGQANRFYADFPHLVSLVIPRFAGHPFTRDFWARGNAWEPAWFVGWTPLLLALYCAWSCRKEKLVRFWLAWGSVGVWLSFGSVAGLYWAAFYVIPGVSNFHDPARFLLWPTLAVAALTAVGLDALAIRFRWTSHRSELLVLLTIVVPILWFASDWIPTTSPRNFDLKPTGIETIRSVAGSDRIAQLANTQFWKLIISDGYRDYGNNDAATMQRTEDRLLSNLDMRNELHSASGYEPVPIGSHVELEGLSWIAQQRHEPNGRRLLDLLDVRILLQPVTAAVPVPNFQPLTRSLGRGSPLSAWSSTSPVSRSWLTRSVYRVEGRKRIAAALASPDFDPRRTTIVSGIGAHRLPGPGKHHAGRRDMALVTWHDERPTRIRMAADAGDAPSFLVVANTAVPGWTARVDGQRQNVLCADGALIGLPLMPGRHDVLVSYQPDSFRLGVFVSFTAIATVVAAGAFTAVRRWGRTARGAE